MWIICLMLNVKCYFFSEEKRDVKRQRSLPERGDPICPISLNIKDEMQNVNLNIAVNDRVWPVMSEECQTEGWGICHWNVFP